jgi:hypothetical protein
MASHSLVRESHQEQTPPRIRIVHVFGSRADFLGAVPKRPNFSAHVLAVDKGHLTHVLVTPTNPPSELKLISSLSFRVLVSKKRLGLLSSNPAQRWS